MIPAESERDAAKANRVVVRNALGKDVVIPQLVSPGNKNSHRAYGELIELEWTDAIYEFPLLHFFA